jgi:cystathionine beta-lyase
MMIGNREARASVTGSPGPSQQSFLLTESALRRRGSLKWDRYDPSVIPCWVAEMDFDMAAPVRRAVADLSAAGAFQYPLRRGRPPDRLVADAFAERMERRYGWPVEPDCTLVVTDLVQAIYAAVTAFTRKGEGVAVQLPAYPPFRAAVEDTGRHAVAWPAVLGPGGYGWDLGRLSQDARLAAKLLILCNPHNPTGRMLSRAELSELADHVVRNDLTVVADEIHADIVYDGRAHIPFASLGPEVARRTVTLHSATKSFGIPGLRCAVMHFGSRALLERFTAVLHPRLLGQSSIAGIEATLAAWRDGQGWFEAVLAHLQGMRDYVCAVLRAEMPEIGLHPPQATYLAWLDCSAMGLDRPAGEFFLHHAKVAFSAGETFDPQSPQFIRMNFATSKPLIDEILDRMRQAMRSR